MKTQIRAITSFGSLSLQMVKDQVLTVEKADVEELIKAGYVEIIHTKKAKKKEDSVESKP